MKKLSIILLNACVLSSLAISAQDNKDEVELGTEITVVKAYTPSVSDAVKLKFKPAQLDTSAAKLDLKYSINPVQYETSYQLMPIPAARIARAPLDKLYRNFARLGFGTHSNLLAELYINSERDRDWAYGAHLRSFSGKGNFDNLPNSTFSSQGAELFAKRFFRQYNWVNKAGFNWDKVRYYGTAPEGSQDDSLRQRFFTMNFASDLFGNHSPYEQPLNHVGIAYHRTTDLFSMEEDEVNIGGRLARPIAEELFTLDADLQFINTRFADTNRQAYFNFTLGPKITAQEGKFNFVLGLNATVNTDLDGKSTAHFYPNVDVRYELLEDIFDVYAGLAGGLEQAGLRYHAARNPFIQSHIDAEVIDENLQFFAGLKGAISSASNFNVGVKYSNFQGFPLYNLNPDSLSDARIDYFSTVYEDLNRLRLFGELHLEWGGRLSLTGAGYYDVISYSDDVAAWRLPKFHGSITGKYNLRNKLIFSSSLYFRDRVNYFDGSQLHDEALAAYADINLGVEYRYNNAVSAFLQLNNLANIKYQQHYAYPVQGFNVLGGFTYKF